MISLDLDCPPSLDARALSAALARMSAAPPRPAHDLVRARAARSARGGGGGGGGGRGGSGGSASLPVPSDGNFTLAAPRWHVLSGNSLPIYYDRWALRSSSLAVDYDCLEDQAAIGRRGNCMVYNINLSPKGPIVPADSAFNGVAIFSLSALRRSGCRYNASPDLRTCEHVAFNLCLKRRGLRLGIDPSLLVGCGTEHAHATFPRTKLVTLHANGTIAHASRTPSEAIAAQMAEG